MLKHVLCRKASIDFARYPLNYVANKQHVYANNLPCVKMKRSVK